MLSNFARINRLAEFIPRLIKYQRCAITPVNSYTKFQVILFVRTYIRDKKKVTHTFIQWHDSE